MENSEQTQKSEIDIPQTQNIVSILWPSFLVACLSTMLFFAFFDPADLGMISGYPDISRLAGYTIGFFVFWLFSGLSSILTSYFRRPCDRFNQKK